MKALGVSLKLFHFKSWVEEIIQVGTLKKEKEGEKTQ